MNWFISTFGSSIGKKWMMAVTGLGFMLFLTGHLAGNLTIYAGKDAFDAYAEHLHSLGIFVNVAEVGLLFFAAIHIITGVVLFFQLFFRSMSSAMFCFSRTDLPGRIDTMLLNPLAGARLDRGPCHIPVFF